MWIRAAAVLLTAGTLASGSITSGGSTTGSAGSPVPVMTPPPVIRLRVIANSDNPVDQALKLKARDAVLRILEPALAASRTRHAAQQAIVANEGRLQQAVNRVLKAYQAPYGATVRYTVTAFPTKAYGSWVLPAGRYQALLIILGRGDGHNWWCVLFPSLCFIDMGNALAVPVAAARQPSLPTPRPADLSGKIRVSWALPPLLVRLVDWLP